jgi:hypothetical protein
MERADGFTAIWNQDVLAAAGSLDSAAFRGKNVRRAKPEVAGHDHPAEDGEYD